MKTFGWFLFAGSFGLAGCAAVVSPPTNMDSELRPTAEDALVDRMMEGAMAELSVVPEDGVFGISRLGTPFHGKMNYLSKKGDSDAYDAYQTLAKNHWIEVRTWGQFTERGIPGRNGFLPLTPTQDPPTRYLWNGDRSAHLRPNESLFSARDFLLSDKEKTMVPIAEDGTVLQLRKIYATNDKCYSCHADVKKGEPIGILGISRTPFPEK